MARPKTKNETLMAEINAGLKEDISEQALNRAIDVIGPQWENAVFFYFTVTEEHGEVRVKRLYRLYRTRIKSNTLNPLRYFTVEIARLIGNSLFCKQRIAFGTYYYDTFSYASDIVLRHDRQNGCGYCLMDLFRLSDFDTDEFGGNRVLCAKTNPENYKKALRIPYLETLCNANDFMFQVLSSQPQMKMMANSLRIARKHGLNLTKDNAYLWVDMWNMLVSLGKDINNPFFIAPNDLKHAHDVIADYLQKKYEKEMRERRREAMIEAIKKANDMKESYRLKHECYNDVVITDGELNIKVLPTIESFLVEGMKQHHCVCANAYFDENKHPNTLILSARIGNWDNPDKYVETIDVDTENWVVRDSRGLQNALSEYHDRIVELMNDNMWRLISASTMKTVMKQAV